MEDNTSLKNRKLWRQLEQLSIMYISDNIKTPIPADTELTTETKDGGYDGKIVVHITENNDISHTIMMEAKFRTSIKSLPLQDCSKALIIAFNRAVQTLYIVTNVLFSPQASEEIENFEKKINLKVIKVDGNKLKQFAEKKNLKLNNEFTQEFLDSICSTDSEEIGISIRLNTAKGEKIAPGRQHKISLRKRPYKFYKNEALKKSLKLTLTQLRENIMMFIVQGAAGVGKTVFLTQLQRELEKKNKQLYMIDLQLCGFPRILFIKILEALWGCELSFLFTIDDPAYIKKELENLIGCLSDGKLDEHILGAVAQAISMDQTALQGHADTYFYYLIEFIYKLISPYQSQNTFLFAFYNLNKSEIDTLHFLYSLLCKIHTVVTVIVELRFPFFVETDERKLISASDYYQKFCNISSECQIVDILPLTDQDDVSSFLTQNGFSLSTQQLEILTKRFGTTPLYLSLASSFIKKQLAEFKVKANELSDSQFTHMIEMFSGTGNNILLTIILFYKQDPVLANCFEAAVLLDGELPYGVLEYLLDKDYENIADNLVETSLFEVVSGALIVRHNLIYDSMKKLSSSTLRVRIAEKLRIGYSENKIFFKNEQIKIFELNFYANQHEYVLNEIENLSYFLLKEHEYYSVIKFNELARLSIEKIQLSKRDNLKHAKILITTLFSYTQLHIFEAPGVKTGLKTLETILNLNHYDDRYTTINLWYLWVQWYIDFYSGNIEQSFQTISQAKDIISEGIFEEQLCGQIYWSYGLSHKRLTTLQEGIEDFKEGLLKYPNSILLKYAVDVHEAHQFLRTDPLRTNKMCQILVALIENTDCFYNEIIQVRVDIAMSAFYSGNYKNAFLEAQRDYDIAQANNISYQEGRSMNIMAACHLMNGNIDEGYSCFKKSYHIFKESGNHLFMWRPSFNIGQIYYRRGKVSKALMHYQKFLQNEITNISERLPNLMLSNSEMVCLIYIARILRKNGKYKEADALYEKYKNPCFEYCYNISDEEFESVLSKLHYIHNGFIIILG